MSSIPPCPALSIVFPNTCSPLPCKRISHPSPLPVTRRCFPKGTSCMITWLVLANEIWVEATVGQFQRECLRGIAWSHQQPSHLCYENSMSQTEVFPLSYIPEDRTHLGTEAQLLLTCNQDPIWRRNKYLAVRHWGLRAISYHIVI